MEILVSEAQGRVPVTVFRLQGDVDLATYEQLQERTEQAVAEGMRDLLLDLTDVGMVSSSGLRAIHHIFLLLRDDPAKEDEQELRKGVRSGTYKSPHFKLLGPNADVLTALKHTGFDMFLEIYTDYRKAIASF